MSKGAKIIAQALYDVDVRVIFGLVGVPVIDIAEEALNLGIRFLAFRNEQAASYAATAYGYLTGRPGVCLLVGGPGILHGMAGIGNSSANSWPLLVLGGSSESYNVGKGAFQEMDAVSLLTPHTKLAIRPPSADLMPGFIADAFRIAYFGRPGPSFVDLPADLIRGTFEVERMKLPTPEDPPLPVASEERIRRAAETIKTAKAPLVVLGKGAAYARAEKAVRALIDRTGLPFLPTPMGKGVVPDSSPLNTAAARSTALREADVVLVLGARLNWILHYGEAPKWNPSAKIIQVDIDADQLGHNAGDASLGLVGDIALVAEGICAQLAGWRWQSDKSPFHRNLQLSRSKNEVKARDKAAVSKIPMTYEKVFSVIQKTLNSMSDPADGEIVYVCEGSNTMDIARSFFPVEHARLRLDAGTYATMGVGLGYAIAAYAAYNFASAEKASVNRRKSGPKKIIAIEGDSAFGFCAMEIETMARYKMDIVTYVINNGGIYNGNSHSADQWRAQQDATATGATSNGAGLRSLTLGYETAYEKIAESCGALGALVRTPEELEDATRKGYEAQQPMVINVLIEPGDDRVMGFEWLDSYQKQKPKARL